MTVSTRRRVLGISIAVIGLALLLASGRTEQGNEPAEVAERVLVLTIAGATIAFGVLLALYSRSADALRLDHFLPFLRKKKKAEQLSPPRWPVRLIMRILPASWFSDRVTGKPGQLRKLLKALGPSVHFSPWRRISQAVCLLAFLWLFFFVLWPYSARPVPPGKSSPGWQLASLEQDTGHLVLKASNPPDWQPKLGQVLYLLETALASDAESSDEALACQVRQAESAHLVLEPTEPLDAEAIDRLLLNTGTWSIFERRPNAWPSHYADELIRKERVPAELFLVIDPLVSLSTAIAARSWVWSLACAGIILVVCVLVPRGFCGYVCPLGTTIDLFDWAIGKRVQRLRVADDGWWVHIKYYLLAATLLAAVGGVLVSGYVAAIPVITRAVLFLGEPLQSGVARGWHLVPPLNAGHVLSISLFFVVLGLGLLKPRFWCKYVCPSGAVFSLGNLFRVTERKVESSCIHCNKCVEVCPFDAIKPDFTTRGTDCTLCQTCGGVCPTHAIKFVERWNRTELKVLNDPPTGETPLGRRGFLSLAAGTAAAVVGGAGVAVANKAFGVAPGPVPVRPPGSVPEPQFLEMCIRCGECFKACPNNVLQPMSWDQGLDRLWTPAVVADWAGCESSCNACGQVCPTGAIRALPLEEKKVARMGLAIVDEQTCLPFAGREACQLCVDECNAAGYRAIEFMQVHTELDDEGQPIPGTGLLAPVVRVDKCVGCGLCQTRCYGINVDAKNLLNTSAIVIEAGEGKEDRLMHGSYVALRQEEARRARKTLSTTSEYYVPFEPAPESAAPPDESKNPFGL